MHSYNFKALANNRVIGNQTAEIITPVISVKNGCTYGYKNNFISELVGVGS